MCGIAGILGNVDTTNRRALARMSEALVHRGPDGHGTWESPADAEGRGVLLAHRRLAILDLSAEAAQPMVDPTTGHVLSFNGEIYNYRSLRDGLEAEGERFSSTGDTAVLARALGRRGTGALAGLRGMYAIAAWDPRRRSLLLARDPLGIKPLYLARNPDPAGSWTVAFASEVRALLASGLLARPRLQPAAVASLVWNGFLVGPDTMVEGVELLPAGHHLELDLRGAIRISSSHAGPRTSSGLPAPSEEEVEAVLRETVRLHLASDVPLAIFLSSGVDSSAVAQLAARGGAPVHTFTLAFEEDGLNEGPAARRIAAAIGAEHREIVLREDDFLQQLDTAIDSLDQPSFDGLNAWYLSHAIRAAGFRVALVGTGGDELFGGYPTFRELPLLHRAGAALSWVPGSVRRTLARGATALFHRSHAEVAPQTRWAKLGEMAGRGADLLGLYQLAYALFLPDFQRALLAPDFAQPLPDGLPPAMRRRLLLELSDAPAPADAIGRLEQRLFLGERLLRDNDSASMAVSLEQRVPLVDHVLVELLRRLPDERRFAPMGQKQLLRRLGLRGLDPALFERPKRGFVLPFDRWIRRGLRRSMEETFRDPAAAAGAGLDPVAVLRLWRAFLAGAPGIYWSRVWVLYVLLRWTRKQGVYRP